MLLRNIHNYMPVYMALITLNDFHQPLTLLQSYSGIYDKVFTQATYEFSL